MTFFTRQFPASQKRLAVQCIGGIALIVFSSLILFEATKATVAVSKDGEKQTVKTHTNTVEELLAELDIVVGEYDALSHDMNTAVNDGMNIDYKQAKQLLLTIDGAEEEYYTTEDTIEQFLASEGLSFSDMDELSHQRNDKIAEGLHLTVATAYEVTIDDGGKEQTVWTTGGPIHQLLAEYDIKLNKLDKVKPALNKDIDNETFVSITRIEKDTDRVEENIAFDIEEKEDNSLEEGKEKVLTEGREGKIVREYEVTKENGKEIDRVLVNEEVKEESEKQMVAIGVKEQEPTQNVVTLASKKSTSSDNNESKDPGGEVLYMEATAFTADCSGCSGYTATGINLNANPNMKVIAVDPSVIPLGSKVWVEGYGTAIAGDTGGSIKGNRIDAHVPTTAAANSFGRKTVKVKVID